MFLRWVGFTGHLVGAKQQEQGEPSTWVLLNGLSCSVAQNRYDSGDRRLPGEEAGGCQRALYRPPDAGLPGETR